MACALFSFPHYFSAPLLFFSVVLFWNVSCNFFSPCLAKPLDVSRAALMIVRVQNDFMKNGPVEVPGANSIIPIINSLLANYTFKKVFVVKDWHPANHFSFAANHEGSTPFTMNEITVKDRIMHQYLWPVHCVMNTQGASLSPNVNMNVNYAEVYMGNREDDYSKSAFTHRYFDVPYEQADLETMWNMVCFYIDSVVIVGIDVEATAIDAVAKNFDAIVIADACAYSTKSAERAITEMEEFEVDVINYEVFPDIHVEDRDDETSTEEEEESAEKEEESAEKEEESVEKEEESEEEEEESVVEEEESVVEEEESLIPHLTERVGDA